MQSNKTTGRLSDGATVSVPRMGFSSRSAWIQKVILETDTAGGKVAGGMRGRGRPDDYPLPKWWRAKWHVLCDRHRCWNGETAKRCRCFPCGKDAKEQQAKHGGSPGAIPFLLWCSFGVPGIILVGWDSLTCIYEETCSPIEPATVVPVILVQKDFNVGGGRLLHLRGKSIFLMKLCILIKRTELVFITILKHQHFMPHKLYLIRTRLKWELIGVCTVNMPPFFSWFQ